MREHSYHNSTPVCMSIMMASFITRIYTASETWKYPTDFSYALAKCIFKKRSLNEPPVHTSRSLQAL